MTGGVTVSLMSSDSQIARQWAEKARENDLLGVVPIEWYRAAARHILATTTPPTMADVEWDAEVHAGLCAEHEDYGTVRMLDHDHHDGTILCLTSRLRHEWSAECDLTPLQGTRLDLTPRREPDPDPTPDHPEALTIEADYRNAPTGTVVATEGAEVWTKDLDGLWETFCIASGYNNYLMADEARQVLRWGWKG